MTERYTADTADTADTASHRYPPFAAPGRPATIATSILERAPDSPAEDDLSPIEQFIDDLPAIDNYLAQETQYYEPEPAPRSFDELAEDSEGWAITGWQSYDWSTLASLGRDAGERAEADLSWGAIPPANAPAGPRADEVAAALDGIAQRIRSGELSIDQFRGMSPEAAMAAALAAMLSLRG